MPKQLLGWAKQLARRSRRRLPFRRFVRQQEGATAVEFGLIAAPFLALMFAIIETALVFFASQTLETAVADSARLVLTGQAQSSAKTDDAWKADPQAKFKQEVCNRLKAMFDCSKGFYVDVRSYGKDGKFADSDMSTPLVNGKLDTNFTPQYKPGSAGEIVVVRVMYEWPIYLSFLGPDITFDLSNMTGSKRMLMSTAAFRNEPFE